MKLLTHARLSISVLSLDSAPAAGRYRREKKGGNGRPAKSGIKRWRSSPETSSSRRKSGCWVNQKKNRESPTFGRIPKCNECFPGMNKCTENSRTYVWSHHHTRGECDELPDCERSHWGTAPVDVLLIPTTEATTCWRRKASPANSPHPDSMLSLPSSCCNIRKSVQFPAAEDINVTQ